MDIYFERIKPLFDQSGIPDAELERNIGIPPKKINQWNARYTKSYRKYIPQIASFFSVSTDYLLGNTDDPRPAGQEKTSAAEGGHKMSDKEIMFALWGDTDEVDEDDLADVRRYAAFIKERKKKK